MPVPVALIGALAMEALELFGKLRTRAQQQGEWTPEQEAESAARFEEGYAKHSEGPPPPPGVDPQ